MLRCLHLIPHQRQPSEWPKQKQKDNGRDPSQQTRVCSNSGSSIFMKTFRTSLDLHRFASERHAINCVFRTRIDPSVETRTLLGQRNHARWGSWRWHHHKTRSWLRNGMCPDSRRIMLFGGRCRRLLLLIGRHNPCFDQWRILYITMHGCRWRNVRSWRHPWYRFYVTRSNQQCDAGRSRGEGRR